MNWLFKSKNIFLNLNFGTHPPWFDLGWLKKSIMWINESDNAL